MTWDHLRGIIGTLLMRKTWVTIGAMASAYVTLALALLAQFNIQCTEVCMEWVWRAAFLLSTASVLMGWKILDGIALEDAARKAGITLPLPGEAVPATPPAPPAVPVEGKQ